MKRVTFQVGSYGVNCTVVVTDANEVYLVDPGADGDRLSAFLRVRGLTPTAILLTHAHFDHIGAVPDLQLRHPTLPVYIHPEDEPFLGHPMNCCPPDYPAIKKPANIRDARELKGIEVIHTPGHTPGGVCYYFPNDKLLLSGDTLFAGSIGRTDFPGGDPGAMMDSLKVLAKLPGDVVVVPGHGSETTIAIEAKSNPYIT